MDEEKPELFVDTISGGLDGSYAPVIELLRAILGVSDRHTIPAISLAVIEMVVNLFPRHHQQESLKKLKKEKEEMIKRLGPNGVLLIPTLPTTAFHHREGLIRFLDVGNTCVFNVMGFPATHIPLGLSTDGLPVGVQCVAAPGNDHLTISVAMYLENEAKVAKWTPP